MNLGTINQVSKKFHDFVLTKLIQIPIQIIQELDPNLKNLLCQLNNLYEQDANDNENLPDCK